MIRTAIVLAGLAVPLTGCAGGRWQDTLTAEDQALMTQGVQGALETGRTGEGANWTNPATGNRGTVMPTGTFKNYEGLDCRDYQQTVTISGDTRVGWGTACRHANGVWVDRRSPALRPAAQVASAAEYRARPRLHFGFGYGTGFGHPYRGWYQGYRFGPYPWYGYGGPFYDPFYDPFYW